MADTSPTLVSRAEARLCGLKRYYTGDPCKHGHVAERTVANRNCVECHNKLIGADRAKHRANFRRWYAKKRETQRLRLRVRRSAMLEESRLSARLWKKKNPAAHATHQRNRKSRLAGSLGTHSARDIAGLRRVQRGKCAYYADCGSHLGDTYHVDHITPVARGGRNDRKNLQLLCVPCNQSKWARDPIEFMRTRGRLL